jgi:hypothetical protein
MWVARDVDENYKFLKNTQDKFLFFGLIFLRKLTFRPRL